jgi:hypothetical protein
VQRAAVAQGKVSLIGSGSSGGTQLRGGFGPRGGGVHKPHYMGHGTKSVQRRKNNARIKKMVAPKVRTDEQSIILMLV